MAMFSFNGFTLEHAREEFYPIAEAWTKADPYHRDTTHPSFWFQQGIGLESYVLHDAEGVVFFFKMRRPVIGGKEIELHIQFPPYEADPARRRAQRQRIMRGLTLGLSWIEKALAVREVHTLFFDSKSPSLIRFCVKRLGFVERRKRLVKAIEAYQPKASAAVAEK